MSARHILFMTEMLLDSEASWCRLSPARDAKGEPCRPSSDKAVSFCMLAALNKMSADDRDGRSAAQGFVIQAIMEITGVDEMRVSILGFNDCGDHASVIRALRRAAELAEAA